MIAMATPLFKFIPITLKKVNPAIVIMLAVLFLWISADAMFGPAGEAVRTTMTIYIIAFILPFTILQQSPKAFKKESFMNFLIGFIGTAGVLLGITFVFGALGQTASIMEPFTAALSLTGIGYGIYFAFVKAYMEEEIFRYAIPKLAKLGDAIASVLFGVFHLAVLVVVTIPIQVSTGALADLGASNWTYAILPVIVLIGLGFVWSWVRGTETGGLKLGIMGSTGSHVAWNLFALGILQGLFLGGLI